MENGPCRWRVPELRELLGLLGLKEAASDEPAIGAAQEEPGGVCSPLSGRR